MLFYKVNSSKAFLKIKIFLGILHLKVNLAEVWMYI